jgi:hypothetical protein
MDKKESKSLLLIIVFFIMCFFYFMKNTNIQGKIFRDKCFDCNFYKYDDYENLGDSPLYFLNNSRIKNINLTYNRFLSREGKIYISYEELNENGKWDKKNGKSNGLNPNDISWTIFNTFHISFKNKSLILEADEDFFKSNQSVFLNGVTTAFENSRKDQKKIDKLN